MSATTAGAMPLRMPLIRFTIDGRRYIGDCTFFASTDLELFAHLAVATPRDGVWMPAPVTDGRLSRRGDVPSSVFDIHQQVHRDRGRGAMWTSQPSVREHSGIDDVRPGAPVEVAIVSWTLSTHDRAVQVDGRKIDAISSYGAGQDITWRMHPDAPMVSGWWGDDTPAPILAAVVMGLARCHRCLTRDAGPSGFCHGCLAWLRHDTDIDPREQA